MVVGDGREGGDGRSEWRCDAGCFLEAVREGERRTGERPVGVEDGREGA